MRLFYPELLSKASLFELKSTLDSYNRSESTTSIEVYTFFLSIWAFQELKDHSQFSKAHFYTLALNDQFKRHLNLQVMNEESKNSVEWKAEASKQRIESIGGTQETFEEHFTSAACFKAFFS